MHVVLILSPKLKFGAPLLRPEAFLVVIAFTGRGLTTNALTHTADGNQKRLPRVVGSLLNTVANNVSGEAGTVGIQN